MKNDEDVEDDEDDEAVDDEEGDVDTLCIDSFLIKRQAGTSLTFKKRKKRRKTKK